MPSITVLFEQDQLYKMNLEQDVYTIGRQESCDIHIDNLGISRNHARLRREGNTYVVEDLGSANGTFVNGDQVQRQPLQEGDVITLGKHEIVYKQEETVQTGGDQPAPDQAQGGADSGLDGALNTMAMDGESLRKRMEQMRSQGSGEGETARLASPTEKEATKRTPRSDAPAGTSTVEIRAREAEIQMLKKDLARTRTLMFLFLLVSLAGVAAAIVLALR
jgi:pSer/pThr/pTyr-binding forkhead associated (FHA) protein